MFGPGDLIFHPKNGCGTIRSLTRRDPFRPGQGGEAGEAVPTRCRTTTISISWMGGRCLCR